MDEESEKYELIVLRDIEVDLGNIVCNFADMKIDDTPSCLIDVYGGKIQQRFISEIQITHLRVGLKTLHGINKDLSILLDMLKGDIDSKHYDYYLRHLEFPEHLPDYISIYRLFRKTLRVLFTRDQLTALKYMLVRVEILYDGTVLLWVDTSIWRE